MKFNAIKVVIVRRTTLMFLMVSFIPAAVLATLSEPGLNFSGGLTLEGNVTSIRNPWVWKLGATYDEYDVKVDDHQLRHSGRVWNEMLPPQDLLLGKTRSPSPTGRDGLAPLVSFGSGQGRNMLNPVGGGVINVRLPVFTPDIRHTVAGSLQFRMKAGAIMRYEINDLPVYAGVYNDLPWNGLPEKGLEMDISRSAPELCRMFAGEGPEWLCSPLLNITRTEPLSRFVDPDRSQIDGVYGAGIVAGSGELQIYGNTIPSSRKATLPVSISYN